MLIQASIIGVLQRSAKRLVRGCENFVPALANLFCLPLPGSCLARFAYLLANLCTVSEEYLGAKLPPPMLLKCCVTACHGPHWNIFEESVAATLHWDTPQIPYFNTGLTWYTLSATCYDKLLKICKKQFPDPLTHTQLYLTYFTTIPNSKPNGVLRRYSPYSNTNQY